MSFIGLICLSAVVNMHEDDSLVTNRLSGFFADGLEGCKHFVWIFFVTLHYFQGEGDNLASLFLVHGEVPF